MGAAGMQEVSGGGGDGRAAWGPSDVPASFV